MTVPEKNNSLKKADWELDFYSRPIIESNGKKRWELLISSTQNFSGENPFRWEKKCSAAEVNSIWLTKALNEALQEAKIEGWETPLRLRFWRPSMKTIIKRAGENVGIDVISSRRTYSLIDWITEREKDLYPLQEGYLAGPLAPTSNPILNQSVPLPEAVQGDALALACLSIETLREAKEWPMEFNGLIPIKKSIDKKILVPGIRLFSKSRGLALAAWLGSLEPVRLILEKNQLILEAGQDERWLVTDLDEKNTKFAHENFDLSAQIADGLQFISIQRTPDEEKFTGFWMLRNLPDK
tara:strand:- start:21400 stop:22290 length:891 start_codon:yes stop_codon:yes gene_type:complete